jgi:23S rRNA (guanosine2251-2'-O)-methyltransferase
MKRLLLGPRSVTEALRANAAELSVVYVSDEPRRDLSEIADEAKKRSVVVEARSIAELDRLAKGDRHQGVVAIGGSYPYLSFEELVAKLPERALLVALDEITDPHNFGAIVRSAVAFGAHGILTLKQRAAPVTPVVVRASAGATEHALIARVTNLASALSTLADQGYDVIGLAAEGASDLRKRGQRTGSCVLVVGSEGRGLRRLVRERCTELVRIPMAGPIESLNASVAAAIALYALSAPDSALDTAARASDERSSRSPSAPASDERSGPVDDTWDDSADEAEHDGSGPERAVWDDDSPFPK